MIQVVQLKRLIFSLIAIVLAFGPARMVSAQEEEIPVPVKFLQNRQVALGLYPEGFRSAAILTAVGFSLEEDSFSLFKRLILLLANQGIRGTFFLSPGEELKKSAARLPERMEVLARISATNFEIAQNGPGVAPEPEIGPEVNDRVKSASLVRRIEAGRTLLTSLGLEPAGYRDLAALADRALCSRLEEMGYIYFCAAGEFASPPVSTPDWGDDRIFTRPAADPGIRKVFPRFDPTIDPEAARREFDRIHRGGGVFIYQVDLPGFCEEVRLGNLKTFIDYLKESNSWFPSLRQFIHWWSARERLGIETGREGETLVIVCDNPTRFPLQNARLSFFDRESPARYYRVEDRAGIMYAQGIIPPEGFINVTILPVAASEAGQ